MNRGTRRPIGCSDDVIRYGVAGAGGHLRQRKKRQDVESCLASEPFAADEILISPMGL